MLSFGSHLQASSPAPELLEIHSEDTEAFVLLGALSLQKVTGIDNEIPDHESNKSLLSEGRS